MNGGNVRPRIALSLDLRPLIKLRVAQRIDLRGSHKNCSSQQYGQDRAESFPPLPGTVAFFACSANGRCGKSAQPVGGWILLVAARARHRRSPPDDARGVNPQACQTKQAEQSGPAVIVMLAAVSTIISTVVWLDVVVLVAGEAVVCPYAANGDSKAR
jgi:hypothetical protein